MFAQLLATWQYVEVIIFRYLVFFNGDYIDCYENGPVSALNLQACCSLPDSTEHNVIGWKNTVLEA